MDIKQWDKLRKGEMGERVNLEAGYRWVLTEMSYRDFCQFARLVFYDHIGNYPFQYEYRVNEKNDSKKAREEYIKYLLYKLIQNLETEGVEIIPNRLLPKEVKLW